MGDQASSTTCPHRDVPQLLPLLLPPGSCLREFLLSLLSVMNGDYGIVSIINYPLPPKLLLVTVSRCLIAARLTLTKTVLKLVLRTTNPSCYLYYRVPLLDYFWEWVSCTCVCLRAHGRAMNAREAPFMLLQVYPLFPFFSIRSVLQSSSITTDSLVMSTISYCIRMRFI